MNRKEFLRQLKTDLFQTVAYIVCPLLIDDLDRVEHMMDRVSGICWHPLPENAFERTTEGHVQVEEMFIAGKGLFLVMGEKVRYVFGKECSECRTMVHWLPHTERFICFLCRKEFSPLDGTGDLQLRRYPVKVKNGTWYVGLKE